MPMTNNIIINQSLIYMVNYDNFNITIAVYQNENFKLINTWFILECANVKDKVVKKSNRNHTRMHCVIFS